MSSPFNTFVLAVVLAVLTGWILKIGQSILLPIFIAVIAVYVLTAAASALGRLPVFRFCSEFWRRLIVLAGFAGAIVTIALVTTVMIEQIVVVAPSYQGNLERLVTQAMQFFGFKNKPDWQIIFNATVGRINLQTLLSNTLASLGNVGGMVFMIIIYASFLMSERGSFATKLAIVMPSRNKAVRTEAIIGEINSRIGDYLAVKTLVNIILGVISFIILWLFGVDFALFWALMIGLLNYIPYVGSLFGVIFPVVLTLAQFGSIERTFVVAILLTLLQMWVGNVLEPRMIGKQVNLSPFVVLVALSVWSALWGLPGAILAIPLTSMMAIILASFSMTRPLAVLLADDATLVTPPGQKGE